MKSFFACLYQIRVISFPLLLLLLQISASGKPIAILKKGDYKKKKSFWTGVIRNINSRLQSDTLPAVTSTDLFVSSSGLNSNNGKSGNTPKLKLDSIETMMNNAGLSGEKVTLNLEANSVFREQLDPYFNGLSINSFNLTQEKSLPRITGMDVVADWVSTVGRSNVYEHMLSHTIELGSRGYTYIMVAEIDTLLEKTHPVSAVSYLKLVNNLDLCQNTPGSYYTPEVTTNPSTVYIHPSRGVPGKNQFRYELTSRNFAINGYYINNSTYSNLFLQSSSYGYGMLAAGDNSTIRNVVFQGGGIHHLVLKSGEIDSTVFLPGPKGIKDRIAMVFYEAEGANNQNKISNSVFLDVPNPIYAHTNGTINHKSLTIDKVFAFGDSSDASVAFGGNDTDSITISNSYSENYPTGWSGIARKINISNSIFRNTDQAAISVFPPANVTQELAVNNVLIKSNGNDRNQTLATSWTVFGVRAPYPASNADVSNTIVHGYSTWKQDGVAVWAFQVGGLLKAYHNIYICDVNENSLMNIARVNNSAGVGKSTNLRSDSNVYIIARGGGFHWYVEPFTNSDININSLAMFQALTSQDKNSILIDLRKNPLGLKAIFVDPENGNWTLTQSPQANAIKSLRAGMTSPPLYYPQRPTYDNVITFRSPQGFSSLEGSILTENESVLRWNTYNEWEVASFEIEYSNDSITFSSVGDVLANSNGKGNSYEFKHTLVEVPLHFYRLKMINKDNSTRYSNVVTLKLIVGNNEDILLYPNPVKNAVTVKYPRREKSSLSIYDFSGKLIHLQTLNAQSSQTILYLNHLPNGMYLIQWTNNKEQSLKKFFKQQ